VAKLAIALNADVIISSRSAKQLEQAAATISDRIRTYAADAETTAQMLKALAPLDYIVVTATLTFQTLNETLD
jgi:saccharopine dehydrogenase-like NADP-dependent oxidoreductase